MKRLLFSFLALVGLQTIQAQVGFWNEHLPYARTVDLTVTSDNRVFCATPSSVFMYDAETGESERFSKANQLSDVGVTAIGFDESRQVLIVGYSTGNLDLVFPNGAVNIRDIAQSGILADKSIRKVILEQGRLYLACGFGVVEVNLDALEISDTWLVGPGGVPLGINDILFTTNEVQLATEAGIYKADRNNAFLADFASWTQDLDMPDPFANYQRLVQNAAHQFALTDNNNEDALYFREIGGTWGIFDGLETEYLRNIAVNDERLLVSSFGVLRFYNADLSPNGVIGEVNGKDIRPNAMVPVGTAVWMADEENGLLQWAPWGTQQVLLDGPRYSDLRRIDAYNNNIWVASGGVDASYVPQFNAFGAFGNVDRQWYWEQGLDDGTVPFDLMDVTINPIDNKEVYFGSFFNGLVRMYDNRYVEVFDTLNSTLSPGNFGGSPRVGVAGVDFDLNGNLWFTNNRSVTPLHVRTADGTFKAYTFGGSLNEDNRISEVLAAQTGYIWAIIPDQTGLLVLNPNETLLDTTDDSFVILNAEEDNGGLPSTDIFCLEEDLDGEMWVGLLQGVAVFYSQECLFEGVGNCDAQQILIEQDGNVQILLETETVNAIEIDGANRKWIGTANSGAFLLSEDGTEQIRHFTEENSPLLSNTVIDIAINQENGDVFFGTDKGIIAYRGDATNFYPEMPDVQVYPNPIEPDYVGDVVIDGLAQDAEVRIADVAGNVVFAATANGGRAVWNRKRTGGGDVSTGVYMVYIASPDGASRAVTKLAVIR